MEKVYIIIMRSYESTNNYKDIIQSVHSTSKGAEIERNNLETKNKRKRKNIEFFITEEKVVD